MVFGKSKNFQSPSSLVTKHAADFPIDPWDDKGYIVDMFYQMSGAGLGGLSFGDFIHILIKELKIGRLRGYVRLYLYPVVEEFKGVFFAIFIRKKDLYVVGVQTQTNGKVVYEVGLPHESERYFTNSETTGFGQQYRELFKGSHGQLFGIWVGYEVLNEAIMRVICLSDAILWAWSIGIFALMFSECCRFVWFLDKLPQIMEQKQSIRLQGNYFFMAVLPKRWTEISNVARMETSSHGPAQPDEQKYTAGGAADLERYVHYAQQALLVYSWGHGPDDNNGKPFHYPGDGYGPGYGDGGGSYVPPYSRGGNNIARGGGGQRGGWYRGGSHRGGGHRGHGSFQAKRTFSTLCFEYKSAPSEPPADQPSSDPPGIEIKGEVTRLEDGDSVSFEERTMKFRKTGENFEVCFNKKSRVISDQTSKRMKIQHDIDVIVEEPVKDMFNASAKDVWKTQDFHLGIPYCGLLPLGGFFSFMITGCVFATRFNIILGGMFLALSIIGLSSLKQGNSSAIAVTGQAVIVAVLFVRQARLLFMKPRFTSCIATLLSGVVVAFYIKRISYLMEQKNVGSSMGTTTNN